MTNTPPWYQTAVIYELHVRSFADSSGDGIGDFRGLTGKLDYFQELGVTALWLLPFYPSPLRDDGYDITDYYSVHPSYGTLRDFQEFLAAAHERGLRVITELVINHTSDQNAWFQRARRAAPGSVERDFYVWSDTPRRFEEARIIFKDFETSNWAWDPVANAYYWHRFYSHQPDLNFDNPAVGQAVFEVLDYWLEMGVDGLRLDAVPYLFEREGTSCENLPETHAYLRELRRHVDTKFPGRMLLAEANQWPEDAAAYFGKGDECHMEFHFPLMPRLFMALQQEDRFPIIDILDQTPAIPVGCQWAIFLRNHDELTLEMVTEEERDYMVRMYARDLRARLNLGIRRRLAPLLGNNRRKIELLHSLLLSLPGTPILYYGDEIGMGDNIYLGDRNGVRTPMQWNADCNAGFSRANPQQLFLPVIIDPEFPYETVNVEMQKRNLSSLFWWIRRMLKLRQKYSAFAVGTMEFLPGGNSKVLTFLRRTENETLLVVANLSRFTQAVNVDLREFLGQRPEELFGHSLFPEISEEAYLFTVGPHGFYWFSLSVTAPTANTAEPPLLAGEGDWTPDLDRLLETSILPAYVRGCRWFGGKQRVMREPQIAEVFVPEESGAARLLLLTIPFAEGTPVVQALPLLIADQPESEKADAIVCRFASDRVLMDALHGAEFRGRLLQMIRLEERWTGSRGGVLSGHSVGGEIPDGRSRLLDGEQSNTSMIFGQEMMLKFFRGYEPGPHPDAQILRALGEAGFPHIPKYLGEIRCGHGGEEGVLALLTSYVENQGDGWTFTLDALGRYFERVLAAGPHDESAPAAVIGGNYPERARQLGQRTGELHRALAGLSGPEFETERFSSLSQRSLYQTLRSLLRRTELELRGDGPSLSGEAGEELRAWLEETGRILEVYGGLLTRRLVAGKIRVHGDLHLGQVLNTGKDFVFLDFEGEPRRSLGERLLKRSPLVDVAGMVRSFDYAVEIALARQPCEDHARLRPWADEWIAEITRAFLDGYRRETADLSVLPKDSGDFAFLLRIFLLDKAVYEIGYEWNYRPEFLSIPLRAVSRILEDFPENHLPA